MALNLPDEMIMASLLGPYNTSDSPINIAILALIFIIVPLLSPYCCYCAHRNPLLLLLCPYIIIVMLALIIL